MQPILELSVVAPTFNERDNVIALLTVLEDALTGIAWELIIVDDNSADGTADLAKELAQANPRLRCIKRIGRRGLSSAAIEGFLASSAPYIALIDADLQHDETRLPKMLEILKADKTDLVIGSRHIENGSSSSGLGHKARIALSHWGGVLAKRALDTELSDPMSGFFAMRRDKFEAIAPKLYGQGFKILVDILASTDAPLRIIEVPYIFRPRHAGSSKLDTRVKLDYLSLLIDKIIGHVIPVRFILFSLVGGIGVGVHFSMLGMLYNWGGVRFAFAQAIAALTAMTTNFFLNNMITYSDRRLAGGALLRGLVSFYIICSIGFFANVGVAYALFNANQVWWLSGLLGALVGAVWNYAASSTLTWKMPK